MLKQDLQGQLDIPQLWKHIYIATIFIQNVLQKKGEGHKAKGNP
jgi:hypothetical protein